MMAAPKRSFLFLATLATGLCATAQYPDSVDIDLRKSTVDTNNIEIYLRANGLAFSDVVSGLTFTIRWSTTSPATLGPRVNNCPDGIPVTPTAQVTNPEVDGLPTGFNYRTYNAFGATLLSEWGCALPQDEWYLVTTIPVQGNDGCTTFNIANDAFTNSPGNARDFFLSLGGYDLTGIIEEEGASWGACAADCLGNVGGTALPGTPCDDGNPDTEGDVYDDQCMCAGLPMGLLAIEEGGVVLQLRPNPALHGGVLVHLEGLIVQADDAATIDVFDALGQRVLTARATVQAGVLNHRLDVNGLDAGAYLVNVTVKNHRYSLRLIVQ